MAPTYWMPGSRIRHSLLTPRQRLTLAVEWPQRPTTTGQHWILWKRRVQALIDANPLEAVQMVALAATHEKTRDLWAIVRGEPIAQIWRGLTGAESTQHLMRQINWRDPGTMIEPPTQTLLEILDVLRLQEAPALLLPSPLADPSL